MTDALIPWVSKGNVAGLVWLVADADGVLGCEGIGHANLSDRRPMDADALFWIASITKPMTAAAFMMFVEEGRIGLDDPVSKYLPECADLRVKTASGELRPPAHPITIREVLSHTAGLTFPSSAKPPTIDRPSLAEAVHYYTREPLLFEPGTDFFYSNAGINTAGRLIEVLSGRSYEDFMQERLFTPLGMGDTTFRPDTGQLARLASAYGFNADKSALVEQTFPRLHDPLGDRARYYLDPMPAGGLFSTAADTAKFGRMLLRGGELDGRRYLRPETIALMASRQIPAHVDNNYGLGLKRFSDDGIFGHNGTSGTNFCVNTKNGFVTVFLIQRTDWETAGGDRMRAAFLPAAARYKTAAKNQCG
ncbi:beta-lactamase [Opitutaceae bacterium TAV5]|nr:beta-lactamase [Opitutaceae bacterium TAV5]